MTAKPTTRVSATELETAGLSATTAVVVLAQKAGFPHGFAGVARSTAGPDVWAGLCCSQFDGIAWSDCSHSSGMATGNTWPPSSSVASNLNAEDFIAGAAIYPSSDGIVEPLKERWQSQRTSNALKHNGQRWCGSVTKEEGP